MADTWCAPPDIHIPLNDWPRVALISIIPNLGAGDLEQFTMGRKFNVGDQSRYRMGSEHAPNLIQSLDRTTSTLLAGVYGCTAQLEACLARISNERGKFHVLKFCLLQQ